MICLVAMSPVISVIIITYEGRIKLLIFRGVIL